MRMSNYPPGVTGSEYQIAGPDYERDASRFCDHCNKLTTGYDRGYDGEAWYDCDVCGDSTDMEDK
jgi:hypothetical protein